MKPELNHAHYAPQGAALTCGPEVKAAQPINHPTSPPVKTVMTQTTLCPAVAVARAVIVAELAHIETASSSDSESSDAERRAKHEGPHNKNSHNAHREGFCTTLAYANLPVAKVAPS